ncbi:MAG: hypothetical protein ABEJ03_00585 [Candidatus Nanohaloarchaea archaeon]
MSSVNATSGLTRKTSSPSWAEVDLALDRQGEEFEDEGTLTVDHDTRTRIAFNGVDLSENIDGQVRDELARNIYQQAKDWKRRWCENPDARSSPSSSALLAYTASVARELGKQDIPVDPEGLSTRIAKYEFSSAERVLKAAEAEIQGEYQAEVFGVERSELEDLIERSYEVGQRKYRENA